MNLSEAVRGFLIARAADGYSASTLNSYRHDLGSMVEYLGDPELGEITSQDVRTFFAWLRDGYVPRRSGGNTKPLAPSTLNNAWCAIRAFYNWASEELHIERPDDNLRQPRFTRPEMPPFSQTDIEKLLDAAQYTAPAKTERRKAFRMKRATGQRDLALVLVLLDTGLRVSECARLLVRDVNLENGEVYVMPWGSGQKTKSRHVYLGKASRKAVWRYLTAREDKREDDPLFEARGRPMDRHSIRLMLDRLGERAGVAGCHPHRFRHTFAVQYLRNGGDVFSLQRLLGHSSLDMVRRYLQLADADSANAHRRASPVDRWKL